MLTESAKIISIEPERIWVSASREGDCGGCGVQGSCGFGLLNRFSSQGKYQMPVSVSREQAARLHGQDQVSLGMDGKLLVHMSLLLYGFPLVGLLGFSGLALAMNGSELLSVGAGVLGLCLGFGLIRHYISSGPSVAVTVIN